MTPKLPLGALLALTTAAFVTVLTEALPAGVLPAMSAGLGVSEAATGQLVTVYAIGTALTAIPLSAATSGWRRKRLLLAGVTGFAVANTVTALSTNYPLTLGARFVAGVAAGVVWALLAGYARRLAPEPVQGKAIAVVMTGIPLALSLGIPAGTFLGGAFGWQVTFSLMSLIALGLLGWIALAVPDFPGQDKGGRLPVRATLAVPGVTAVLFVTLTFVLAHNVLYTYIATFLESVSMGGAVEEILLVFGLASMVSIWIVGHFIDRRLRFLSVASTLLVALGATILALLGESPVMVYLAATLWGLGWGGVPTLLQTAAARAGDKGGAADIAQAMLVTLWNAAMAGGGIAGGVLLDGFGPGSFPWSVLVLLVPTLAVVLLARRNGFTTATPDDSGSPREPGRQRREARTRA
ncbi:MFS transporter [Amycolatopsis regifaucium]|uniref:MFS transporter n=1 Tax=Amycolatopsis regifaucium TaxID=546365 RepID=A0A154MH74_9PSEU|nr:MFS transporter [Amycolatopsis regifaucium]KZB83772.1 MFS transporter [Amycolatopsis regifaucium]OKA06787.1 MFS transporter [Amycolatopsis regifaucium]SFH26728.1 Predicted arabinose efflux permease, MFS family [Amycolatopsis regifaucium]